MAFPPFVPLIDETVRSEIQRELDDIERRHDVRLLFAIESGSRAWGFPSPDSDYDVRFVYAHRRDWYLDLFPGRDVIELPISDDLDIGGWDIRKALTLLLKPNPVMLEWLSSPIRYRWNDRTCDDLIRLSRAIAHENACRFHYLKLGESQWRRHVGEAEKVNLKKYFYVLRPALALRWLRLHPEEIPPMNLQDLVPRLDLDPAIVQAMAELLARKAETKELGGGTRIAHLDEFIQSEFEIANGLPVATTSADQAEAASALFRRIVLDWT